MKHSKKELIRREYLRHQGESFGEAEKHNQETWMAWQGFHHLLVYQQDDPKTMLKITIGVDDIPSVNPLKMDLSECVLPNPKLITDERKRLLAKWRVAIKELAGAEVIPMAIYDEIPKHDPKENLRALNSLIYTELGKSKMGTPDNVATVFEKCVDLGEPDFEKLDGEVMAGITLGRLVHPLALKPLHLDKLNGNATP